MEMQLQNVVASKRAPSAGKHFRAFDSAHGDAVPSRKTSSRTRAQRAPRISFSDEQLIAHALDSYSGLWTLEVSHAGEVAMKLNGHEIAFASKRDALSILTADACPYIRAADLVDAVTAGLAVVVCDAVRANLEFGLARWIPLYFDL